MSDNNTLICSYMKLLPVYVQEDDLLITAFEKMKYFEIDTLSVIDKDFSISGYITKRNIKDTYARSCNMNILNSIKVKDVINKNSFPLILYPNMNIKEAYLIMQFLRNRYVPIANLPWEKKMIGVLCFEDVISLFSD